MGGASQTKPIHPPEEDFEVLDIRGTAKPSMSLSWLQDFLNNITREPATKQAAVGGASGWVVGYLSMKVGKIAATVVGGSLIVMQLAAHKGYIKVDWNKVNKDLEKNAKKLKREMESNVNPGSADENMFQEAARQFDKKFDKVTGKVNRKLSAADTWFNKQSDYMKRLYRRHILGENSSISIDDLYMLNMYLFGFSVGLMFGAGTGKVL